MHLHELFSVNTGITWGQIGFDAISFLFGERNVVLTPPLISCIFDVWKWHKIATE